MLALLNAGACKTERREQSRTLRQRGMMRNWGEAILNDLIAWVLAFLKSIGMWRTRLGSFNNKVVEIPLGFTTLVPLLEPRRTRLSRGPTRFTSRSLR